MYSLNHVFLILWHDMRGLAHLGESAPSRASQFWGAVKDSPLICTWSSSEPVNPYLLSQALILWAPVPTSWSLKGQAQTIGQTWHARAHGNLRLANPKPPPCFSLCSCGNPHKEALTHISPYLPSCLLTNLCALAWQGLHPFLGTLRNNLFIGNGILTCWSQQTWIIRKSSFSDTNSRRGLGTGGLFRENDI